MSGYYKYATKIKVKLTGYYMGSRTKIQFEDEDSCYAFIKKNKDYFERDVKISKDNLPCDRCKFESCDQHPKGIETQLNYKEQS